MLNKKILLEKCKNQKWNWISTSFHDYGIKCIIYNYQWMYFSMYSSVHITNEWNIVVIPETCYF